MPHPRTPRLFFVFFSVAIITIVGCASVPDGRPDGADAPVRAHEAPGTAGVTLHDTPPQDPRDGAAPFVTLNLVRHRGVQLALPPGWYVTETTPDGFQASPPDIATVVLLSTDPNFAAESLTLIDATAHRKTSETIGGTPVRLYLREYDANTSYVRAAEWDSSAYHAYLGFRGSPSLYRRIGNQTQAVVSSVRFPNTDESVRVVDGLFAFHSYGTGWSFHHDVENGAVFVWSGADNQVGDDDKSDTDGDIAIVARRTAPTSRACEPDVGTDVPTVVHTGERVQPHLNPIFTQRYELVVSIPTQGTEARDTTAGNATKEPLTAHLIPKGWGADEGGANDLRWQFSITREDQPGSQNETSTVTASDTSSVPTSVDTAATAWGQEVLRDRRVQRFFGGCFVPLP